MIEETQQTTTGSPGAMFDVAAISDTANKNLASTWWFALEGPSFGPEAPRPLKVHVGTGGQDWSPAWTKGCGEYARKLPQGERKRFTQNAQTAITTDAAAVLYANRYAIRETGIIVTVALAGPVLHDPEAELPTKLAEIYGVKKLPEHIVALYRKRLDGRWHIPVHTPPPAEFIARPDQIEKLLKYEDFVTQIAGFRKTLAEEQLEIEEDELENLPPGSARNAHGQT